MVRTAHDQALKRQIDPADALTTREGGGLEMATIRASCSECGDVELTTSDVHVRVCAADNQGSYLFRCPLCAMTVVKPAEARTIDLLVASGVSYETWSPPLELSEPRGFGAPISHDELIDFHDFLRDERQVWDALATTPGRSA
jgi:hypothetical protein